jgi:hypothetical protein
MRKVLGGGNTSGKSKDSLCCDANKGERTT